MLVLSLIRPDYLLLVQEVNGSFLKQITMHSLLSSSTRVYITIAYCLPYTILESIHHTWLHIFGNDVISLKMMSLRMTSLSLMPER